VVGRAFGEFGGREEEEVTGERGASINRPSNPLAQALSAAQWCSLSGCCSVLRLALGHWRLPSFRRQLTTRAWLAKGRWSWGAGAAALGLAPPSGHPQPWQPPAQSHDTFCWCFAVRTEQSTLSCDPARSPPHHHPLPSHPSLLCILYLPSTLAPWMTEDRATADRPTKGVLFQLFRLGGRYYMQGGSGHNRFA
jgi:hypothetical protein